MTRPKRSAAARAPSDFAATFAALRAILAPYAADMVVTADTPDAFMLDMHHIMKNGRRLSFAGVRKGKSYVSYHLMPVYGCPELVADPGLRARMQGKSCFNFRTLEPAQRAALVSLTKRAHALFVRIGHTF